MARLFFYLQYGARNLWRSRRWSAFAVFSVAAGVATVVALRSLGLAIEDALTRNVRSINHGDITLAQSSGADLFSDRGGFGSPEDARVFNERQLDLMRQWAADNDAQVAEYTTSARLQVSGVNQETIGALQFITSLLIDPATYPPTQDIYALDGRPLSALFQGGREVVISENLARMQGIHVGDVVRVSGSTEPFVVRGIVPTQAEAGLRSLFAAFFGFAYFNIDQAEALSINPNPNTVSIALPEGTPDETVLRAGDELHDLMVRSGRRARVYTVPRIVEQNRVIADLVGRFVVVMGLGALLLGGVGIINTMLVMVRRRTDEIAALKTFGLKGRQVAALFMTEALLLGAVGSVVGSVVGVALSAFTNAYGETFIQQPLTFRVYPQGILFGVVLGMVVTAIFGVLPVLTAVRVRPNIILRPNETHIPKAGVVQSLFALAFVVVSLGLITGQIIGPFPERYRGPGPMQVGLIGVTATLALLGVLVGILWVVVWLVSKLPAFGWVELRLALRNMTTRRIRTATTLLALSAGMFALSSITFFSAGVREILQFTLTDTFGGNVAIVPLIPSEVAQPIIDRQLDQLPGITYRTLIRTYRGEVISVDGAPFRAEFYDTFEITVRDTNNPNVGGGLLVAGRHLTLEDRGRAVAVVKLTELVAPGNIQVGSTIVMSVRGQRMTFEVVGLVSDERSLQTGALGDMFVPPGVLDNVHSDFQLNTIQVEPQHLNEVQVAIASLPLMISLDVATIDSLLSRLIEQFSALPLLVGLLSLGAAAVIMANTVALSVLERRRQIGILKAVGLKGRRVLRIMLLENILVSLLGGVIGIGLSALGVAVLTRFGLEEMVIIPRDATPVALALVAAAVMIGCLATFLSANVAVRERVLNVLRYE